MERLINRILYGTSTMAIIAGLLTIIGIAGRDDMMMEMGIAYNPFPGLLAGLAIFVVGFGLRVLAVTLENKK